MKNSIWHLNFGLRKFFRLRIPLRDEEKKYGKGKTGEEEKETKVTIGRNGEMFPKWKPS